MQPPRSILVTGASSGLGEALARRYAAPGIHLALTGRDETRLFSVARDLRAAGAIVLAKGVDVRDGSAMAAFVAEADAAAPLDLVIANAGISRHSADLAALEANAREIFAVNIAGVCHTLHPAIERMAARRSGQLAIVSSLASLRGMPGGAAYCASKAAVRVYGEGLRAQLVRHGIAVSVICPGFVTTRMTAGNRFPMPFLMDSTKAARLIARGLARNRGRIAFPWRLYGATLLLAALPERAIDGIARHLPDEA